jgi:chromate reductase
MHTPHDPNPHQVRVLAIPGSLRRHSYNRSLLEAAAEVAPSWMPVWVYEDLAEVPLFNEDLEVGGPPSGVQRLHDAVAWADAVLIATPAYNQSVPGVLKNALDWLSRADPPASLSGKPVAVTGVTTGPWGTRIAQTMLRQMLVSMQAVLLPQPMLYVREAGEVFDDAGRLVDPSTRERLGELVEALGMWAMHVPGYNARQRERRMAEAG